MVLTSFGSPQHLEKLDFGASHPSTKLLTGFADYSVWYDSAKKNKLATNIVIIEAKRRYYTDTV